MQKFKKFMTEGPSYDAPMNPAAGGFGDPEVLSKINGLLGRMCMENSNSSNLEPLVRQIRSSLSKMGLTFDQIPSMTEDKGSALLPLTLYGGRFGKLPETAIDEFVNDDGLQDQVEGGLSLDVQYEKNANNTYRCSVEIK